MSEQVTYGGAGPVAVIGAGLIGASWAALFLHHGRDVRAYDPSEEARARLQATIALALADLAELGGGGAVGSLTVAGSLEEALAGAVHIQENAPEKFPAKQALIAELDALAPPGATIGSSTTSFMASELTASCPASPRVFVAHPYNPPHLVPLVEIGPAPATSPEALAAAEALYASCGKVTIRIRVEARGHIANRLSAALFREAVHIVRAGIATAEDVDAAIRFGPGLRWAADGPFMTYHLGGGPGGIRDYLARLGPAQEARWADLGAPSLDPATVAAIAEEVERTAGDRSVAELEAERSGRLKAILAALEEAP
ncbi:3-hydroxyacyl-CoA dehydrogenase NAD-binding domain-containing protein [Pseudoroseicyclus sp. CXY001]|uniref:3-hydroxyacyl-CoA dehydrogenase NAD-binding domain-containing protein n=1 Tax=Pseudoroseicyclus sp. CXY001 TaxID=3242492 RepID=UPI00358DD015